MHLLFVPNPCILHVVHLLVLRFHASHLHDELLEFAMLDDTWKQCVNAFLRSVYLRSQSLHTLRNYESTLSHFFTKHPEDMRRSDVEAFLERPIRRSITEVSPGQRNYRLSVIKGFYTYASTYEVPGPTGRPIPLFRGSLPTVGIRRAKTLPNYRVFTPDDLERLFSVIPTDTVKGLRDRAIFLTLFLTARRREEICALTMKDIFCDTILDEHKRPRKVWLYRWRGKGRGGAYDTAELPPLAKIAIDRYLEASGRLPTMDEDSPIFVSIPPPDGGGLPIDPWKPITGSGVLHCLKRYLHAAGLDPALCIHSFRHASARERYLINPDPRAVQKVLRHANLQTTSHYLSMLVTPDDPVLDDLEEKFNHLL